MSEEPVPMGQAAQQPGEARTGSGSQDAMPHALQTWTAEPAVERLMPLLRKLHTAPRIYGQVTEELRSPNCSIEDVARLIAVEPVMTAKLLQVVNSAFFGLRATISEPVKAVMFLGTERTRALILLAGIFSQFEDQSVIPLEDLWSHSLQVGTFARTIALGETKDAKVADLAYTAGLLHDIGKLFLAGNVPDLYRTVVQVRERGNRFIRDAELEVLGTTHAKIGACLLGTWGLPMPLLEAIFWHHEPECSPDTAFSLVTAVHVANTFAQECGCGSGDEPYNQINLDYLTRLGLADRPNVWRKLCSLRVPL
jgi:HD-like signal output (HDOD) protein